MIKNEKLRIWVNRIFAFLVGVLLIFLIMNFSVVSNVNKQNEELKEELDDCKYEANRLLNNAKAYFENKKYDNAKEALDALFEKHPGSNEAAEGKKVYTEIEDTVEKEQIEQEEIDKKWEAAAGVIRERWGKEKTAQLKEQLEKDMNDILDKEWEKEKDEIREEWEKEG